MAKNLSEVPMLNSVVADYTVGYSHSTSNNSCMPRRVSTFSDNHWIAPNIPSTEDILSNLGNDTTEVKRLRIQVKNLTDEIKQLKKLKGEQNVSTRRLVKVVIVDPNENLKLEDAVLINEAEKITDLEDNEIFFDMDIKKILEAHNTKREATVDKKASKNKDKDVFLDPIKIRDLKMTVITVAEF